MESTMYKNAVLVPVLSILSILVSITPFCLHWKNRNFPAACLIFWFLILNLFNIVNAFIWPHDDIETWFSGAGLCDVEVKVMIASYVAVPGNILCIFRSLGHVLDTKRANLVPTKRQRWRNRFMDILFCVAVPFVAMCTHFVYQANRYMLFGISGCVNSFDESWMSFVLSFMWPPIITFIAGYYCSFVLYRLHKYRSQFGNILQSSNSNFSKSRFIRLFLLSFTMLMAIIPVQIYVVYKNVQLSLPWHPYSIRAFHRSDWNTIVKIPSNGVVFFDRWIPVTSGFMFFLFFGCGRDASRMYKPYLRFLGLGICIPGVRSSTQNSSSSAAASINSRAKLLFNKNWTSETRTNANNLDTRPDNQSYDDIESGTALPRNRGQSRKSSWNPLSLFRHSGRGRMLSVPDLSAPSNSVSTNAWAGTSHSRSSHELTETPSRKEFIRVKQELKQESETHV